MTASIRVAEAYGTFVCRCGAESDFEDCTMPALHECPSCHQWYTVAFHFYPQHYPPKQTNCTYCGEKFLTTHRRGGGSAGSYYKVCWYCRRGPSVTDVAKVLGVTKQRISTRLKHEVASNPSAKRADLLRGMLS